MTLGLGCFFTFMTITEGGGRRAVAKKLQDVYVPTLKANFMLWPTVQILNFRVIPIQFQLVSSCIDIRILEYRAYTGVSSRLFQLLVSSGQHTCH